MSGGGGAAARPRMPATTLSGVRRRDAETLVVHDNVTRRDAAGTPLLFRVCGSKLLVCHHAGPPLLV